MKRYVNLSIACDSEELSEIVVAYLSDYDFECFDVEPSESGVILQAYIIAERWNECRSGALEAIADYGSLVSEEAVEDENWNERWEQESFHPVDIDGRMVIRAPHHEAVEGVVEVIVAPQMSFGSGHHETTRMMCRAIMATACCGQVVDVGCGTGVLSIAALKCGAQHVDAVDIDPWSVESARNSALLNDLAERMDVVEGTVEVFVGRSYDMVMANINRNIILNDLAHYVAILNDGGSMLLSGFLSEDVAPIVEAVTGYGLSHVSTLEDGEWRCLTFVKP